MGLKAKDRVALELRVQSWREIFHILHEVALGKQTSERAAAYRDQYGTHFSSGPFWALIQNLEGQLQEAGVDPRTWSDPRRIEEDAE